MSSRVQVDHVQLPIPLGGSAKARRFYQDALGLSEWRDPRLDRPGIVRFNLGDQRLDLSEGFYTGVAPQAHLALGASSLDTLVERLRQHGIRVDVSALSDGRAYTEDPFGNRIELVALPLDSVLHQQPHRVNEVRIAC